jgi:hypothetical protein
VHERGAPRGARLKVHAAQKLFHTQASVVATFFGDPYLGRGALDEASSDMAIAKYPSRNEQ